MNDAQMNARKRKIYNTLNKADKRTSYEKQADKRKSEDYVETVKRID